MFRLFILLIVLLPLPFGAVHPWAWGVAGVAVGLLLMGWCTERLITGKPPAVAAHRIWPVLLFFGIASGWAMLQASPFMPESWHHPVWAEAAKALGGDPSDGYISVNPYETGSALVLLLTHGGIFWLALQYGRDRKRAATMFYALVLAGLAYASYGLVVEFSASQTILWFDKTSYQDSLTSTFINRNSYATYAGLGLVVTTGLLVDLFGSTYRSEPEIRRERWRQLAVRLTTGGWALVVAWLLLATALLLTDSRGGFLSACAGVVAVFMASAASRGLPIRLATALASGALSAGLALFILSGDTVMGRLAGTDIENESRLAAYSLTLQAISDSPWRGTGYGSFGEVFRMYRDEAVPDIYDRAHNTYLENTLEFGIPASVCLLLAVASAVLYCARGISRRRRDMVYPIVGLSAAILVGCHSLVDFSLQVPAVGATFALILGAGCAQSWSSQKKVT
jgi:O-antigen ligase